MIEFSTNQILFKIKKINKDVFETTSGISSILGSAFHKAMEVYYGGSDTLIVTNEEEAIEYGLKAGMDFLDKYNDGFIQFSDKIPNKEKAFALLSFLFQSYIKETPYVPNEIIAIEDDILEKIDIEYKGEKLSLPIKLKGRIDKVIERESKLIVVDYKTCYKFSDPEKIDGAKIIQAVEYYFLGYAKYGRAPYSCIFEEIKYTRNNDKSPQVKRYEIVYADNELYFDFYLRFYEDMIRALMGEMVYVPNVRAIFDNEIAIIAYIHRLDIEENAAKLLKKHNVTSLTDVLKREMHSANNMKKLIQAMDKNFISAKNLNYNKMKNEEKIATKLMEHGMLLQFDSVVQGSTVDLYRYTPSIGLKMSKIKTYVADVEQVLGIKDIRILAPIPGTTFVGFEVPRAERQFPAVPGGNGFDIAIGETITGEPRRFDIRQAPHMLVAGASGSGKSVFLNGLIKQISSLGDLHLFDPKIVELKQFKDIAVEYETEADKINESLGALVIEMEERYQKLADMNLKNIEGTDMRYKFVVIDEFGDIAVQNPEGKVYWELCEDHQRWNDKNGGLLTQLLSSKRKLRVREQEIVDAVVFCNECVRKVLPAFEDNLLRLAAKGRAAGIHLIIATQSPRVEVIKGSIKANFPTKVLFKTSKAIDSTVVIDEAGAEKLLGKGDMLFAGDNGIERLQGYNSDN